MPRLSKDEYLSFFGKPMTPAAPGTQPPFDFWTYFEQIPEADFDGHDFSKGEVDTVYIEPTRRYEHVLINSEDKNVFLVLILDRQEQKVVGHRVLDLNEEYGLTSG